jgi:hypothetical protein
LWRSLTFGLPLALVVVLSGCSSKTSTNNTSTTRAPTTTTSPTSTTSAASAVTPITGAGGTVAAGSVTCTNVTGTITFTPPLSNTPTGPETTHISLNATGCTTAGSSGTQVTSGTATATIQSSTNGCVSLLTSKPVAVAVAWSPSSIHATVASFGGYAIVTDATQHTGFGLPNAKGSVSVAGSFAGTDNGAKSTASTYSNLTSVQLLTACGTAAGLPALAISSGTVTFS